MIQTTLQFNRPKHRKGTLYDIILRKWAEIPQETRFYAENFIKRCVDTRKAKMSNYERRMRDLRQFGEIDYEAKDGVIRKIR